MCLKRQFLALLERTAPVPLSQLPRARGYVKLGATEQLGRLLLLVQVFFNEHFIFSYLVICQVFARLVGTVWLVRSMAPNTSVALENSVLLVQQLLLTAQVRFPFIFMAQNLLQLARMGYQQQRL